MIEDFPSGDMKNRASTPAAQHLLKTRDNIKKLLEKKAQIFYNIVARVLFLSKTVRSDVLLTIAFLCT